MNIDEAIKEAEDLLEHLFRVADMGDISGHIREVEQRLALLRFVKEHDKDMNGREATSMYVRGPCTCTWTCSEATKYARAAVDEALK